MIGPLLLSLTSACPTAATVSPSTPVALTVTTADPELRAHEALVLRRLRALAASRVDLLGPQAVARARTAEGGARARAAAVIDARVQLERARNRFRELDDAAALASLTDLIAGLVPVQQAEGATNLLARAHVLAAAIYLARGELDAVQSRLHRALDLDPEVSASRERFDPRLLAELAAAADSRDRRATGRLEVRRADGGPAAVFLDGRRVGSSPVVLDAVPAGRHLLRVSARGQRSEAASILVQAGETTRRRVHLRPDPEQRAMQTLAEHLRGEQDPAAVLGLLAERAGARHAVVAELLLSPDRSEVGTATVGVRLWSSTGGRGWAPNPRADNLAVALGHALGCQPTAWPARRAPALVGLTAPAQALAVIPAPEPWWRRPWVWAIAAGLAMGTAGALVAARANAGPAEAVSVTLVPRP